MSDNLPHLDALLVERRAVAATIAQEVVKFLNPRLSEGKKPGLQSIIERHLNHQCEREVGIYRMRLRADQDKRSVTINTGVEGGDRQFRAVSRCLRELLEMMEAEE
jgi:precorrin-3B methylase